MKRSSIIQGVAHWANKTFAPNMPSFSPVRIGLVYADKLAQAAPDAAIAILSALPFGSFLPALLAAADTDFDAAVNALADAVRQEEKIVLTFQTPLGPKVWSLVASDITNIANEIKTAEANK